MAVEPWAAAAAANGVLAVAYGWLAALIVRGLAHPKAWRRNPLATATAGLLAAFAAGHAIHLLHLSLPAMGVADAARAAADPRIAAWDGLAALAVLWHLAARSRLPPSGRAALCDDLAKRRRQASDLQEGVVRDLVRAQDALALGQREEAHRAVAAALESARAITSALLGHGAPQPGDLRHAEPSGARP